MLGLALTLASTAAALQKAAQQRRENDFQQPIGWLKITIHLHSVSISFFSRQHMFSKGSGFCREDEAVMRLMESGAFKRKVMTEAGLYSAPGTFLVGRTMVMHGSGGLAPTSTGGLVTLGG
jgi:hypothetical protein